DPGPARTLRRGWHRAGAARAGGRPLRRRRGARLGARDGQGQVQGGHARRADPGDAEHHPARGRRARESLRVPRLRQTRAALIVPPRMPQEQVERVQRLAVESVVVAECEGMARVDFFVREDGEVLVNELNTIPGFTSTSVYAKLFEASGIPYPELLDRLVELALERHERRSRLSY